MKRALFSMACSASLLAACGDLSGLGGTNHYACKAPDGVQCQAVSGTYANALQGNLPGQRSAQQAPAAALVAPAAPPVLASATAPGGAPPAGQALRSPERVLRLWIKPWKDRDNDLFDESLVYLKIESGRWLVQAAQERVSAGYRPVRAPAPAGAAARDGAAAAAPADGALAPGPTLPPMAPVPPLPTMPPLVSDPSAPDHP